MLKRRFSMGQDRRFTPRETSSGKICDAGADGSVTVNRLPFGVYSLEEKQAPEGMAKSQERYRVELKAPGQTEEGKLPYGYRKKHQNKGQNKDLQSGFGDEESAGRSQIRAVHSWRNKKCFRTGDCRGEYADCFGVYRTGRISQL